VNRTTEWPANEPPSVVPVPVVVPASPSSTIIFPVASNLRTFCPLWYALEASSMSFATSVQQQWVDHKQNALLQINQQKT